MLIFQFNAFDLLLDLLALKDVRYARGQPAFLIFFNLATFVSAAIVNNLTVLFLPDKAISRFVISVIGMAIMAVIAFIVQLYLSKSVKSSNQEEQQ